MIQVQGDLREQMGIPGEKGEVGPKGDKGDSSNFDDMSFDL